jgi:hypothetical protein
MSEENLVSSPPSFSVYQVSQVFSYLPITNRLYLCFMFCFFVSYPLFWFSHSNSSFSFSISLIFDSYSFCFLSPTSSSYRNLLRRSSSLFLLPYLLCFFSRPTYGFHISLLLFILYSFYISSSCSFCFLSPSSSAFRLPSLLLLVFHLFFFYLPPSSAVLLPLLLVASHYFCLRLPLLLLLLLYVFNLLCVLSSTSSAFRLLPPPLCFVFHLLCYLSSTSSAFRLPLPLCFVFHLLSVLSSTSSLFCLPPPVCFVFRLFCFFPSYSFCLFSSSFAFCLLSPCVFHLYFRFFSLSLSSFRFLPLFLLPIILFLSLYCSSSHFKTYYLFLYKGRISCKACHYCIAPVPR